MKRCIRLLILSLLLLQIDSLYSQDTIIPAWVIEKVPPVSDQGNGWSVAAGGDGFLYWSTNQSWNNVFKDQVLYKLDTAGNEVWPSPGEFAQTQTEQSYVVTEHNGIVYTAGRICDCVNLNLICCDFSIVAWDPINGDTLWSQRYDVFGEYEECDGIWVEDTVMFVSGWTREANANWFDVLVMKLDLQGNIIWQTVWDEGIDKDERQDGHIFVDEDHIFMCGISQGIPNVVTALSGFDGQATIWKFDRNGNYIDHDSWGFQEPYIDIDDALGMTSDGTYLYAVGFLTTSADNSDWFIRKYDKDLNMIWEDLWGGTGGEAGRAAAIDDDGNIWCAVNTFSQGDSSQSLALLKYTPSGTLDAYYLWGDERDEHFQDIKYYQNAFYCSGFVRDTLFGYEHPLLIKVEMDDLNTNIEVPDYPRFNVELFPNPSSGIVYLDLMEVTDVVELVVQDVQGRIVHGPVKVSANAEGRTKLDLEHLNNGTFVLTLKSVNRKYSRSFVITDR